MTSKPPPGYEARRGVPTGFSAAPSAPTTPPPPAGSWASLEPLSRRLLTLAALLSLLLIAAVADSALHSDGNPFNPIAAAAVRTQAAPGARFTLEAIYTSAALPQPVVAHGSGTYNSRTGRSRATLEVPSSLGAQRIETVADSRTTYTRSEAISAGLPPGRPWLGVQPWLGRSDSAALVGNGAGGQLEMMRAVASGVQSVGEESIRGVPTHRYRGSIELHRYAQLLREEGKAGSAREYEQLAKRMPAPVEVEAWVDDSGMARRLREVMTLPAEPGHSPVTMDMRMDLFGFGTAPSVKLPASHEVFDSTPLAQAELGLLDGESAQRLIAPAGRPLPMSAYRRRSGAICTGIESRIQDLKRRAAPKQAAMERFFRDGGPGSHSQQETLRIFRSVSYAYYEPALTRLEEGLGRLGRLSPPAARVAAFRHFMRQSATYLEVDLAETRAVEVGSLKLAQSLSDRLHSMSGPIGRATRAAGLASICATHDEPGSGSSSASSA